MKERQEFDFCVVGVGSAGFAAACTARDMGKSVAVVDGSGVLAGLCILRGCMPSKTLLRSAEIAHVVKEAPKLGVIPRGADYDVRFIIQRKRRIIADFADYRVKRIESFPLFRGSARFTGDRELSVDGQTITARKFLIATGSVINEPTLPGLAEAGYLDSDAILELETLPRSVVVLGGGATACELAQYLARLGVKTTMLQRSARIMSFEDADIADALQGSLQEDGIELHTGVTLRRAEKTAAGKRIVAELGGREAVFDAEEIFFALGRRPNVDGFDFEATGVQYDRTGVQVDEYLQTSNPDIYAAGDVTGMWELVHVAVYGGQLGAHNAFTMLRKPAQFDLQMARAVFTDPQVAIAGLTEGQCLERGIEYEKAWFPFDDLGKAITAELTQGFIKMLAARDGRIIGVGIVGAEAGDLIHEAIALIYFKASVRDVLEMPHLHPTLAEIITYPAEELNERLKHQKHVLVTP
jgi:pyruvate/2-oxoglutarate dehydrogenase complex dihydrolipoamide dehydrogenase (E3) component